MNGKHAHGLPAREERFLNRLSARHEQDAALSRFRSYLIAGAALLVLFAISRWVSW